MIALKKSYQKEANSDEWWGYSAIHGWVMLDKTMVCNRVSSMPEGFVFLRCRDWTEYEQGAERWSYQEAERYLDQLPPAKRWAAEQELLKFKKELKDTEEVVA